VLREIFADAIASLTERSPESTDSTIRQRLRATACNSVELLNHFGSGWGWCFGRPVLGAPARAEGVLFMAALLRERNGGLLIAHAHLQGRTARTDREVPVAEPTDQIEGLAKRLLTREAQCVLPDRRLDRRTHRGSRTEEAVRRGQPLERLVRTLEVVVLHEQRHAPLTVLKVSKYRARQQLLPQRLPEALDLAAGLRVVRAALHVRNPVALELRFELSRSAPRGVLAPLVGQDLARCAVVCDRARERLQHQSAPLVMRHRQAHQVPRVIVEECRHVDPFVSAQQKRKQVRLPQLIGLGTLEAHFLALGLVLHPHSRARGAFGLQYPLHRAR
jgi:hypothetical protein